MTSQSNRTTDITTRTGKFKRKPRFWLKILIVSILAFGLLGTAGAFGFVYYLIQDAPAFTPEAFNSLSATTNVYDRNDQLLGSMQSDGERELIKSLDEVSPYVVQAFVAAEDADFYKHFGIDPISVLRAAYQNFIGGGIVSGGSTITQQTVKNVMFPAQEQTIKRKVQEMYLSVQLERAMSKNEILVHYLNWIYFGKSGYANIYGIKAASKAFFNKDPRDLNLAQAAILAALPNNPGKYNPYTGLKHAITYQNYVLNEMMKAGYITQEDYQKARSFDIEASIVKPKVTATGYNNYPFVISEVERRAAEKLMSVGRYDNLDDARQALFKGGYKVYTTIDRNFQDAVDQVLADDKNFYGQPISYRSSDNREIKDALQQAGATLLDNQTGGVLAIGGGRDYKKNQNNHTTLPRQPGSTMKPLSVYGPAVEKKLLSPGSVLDDTPMALANPNAAGGKYFPMNYDNKFHGLMTAREALKRSYNIPAIKTTELVTPAVGLDYVKKMGVTTLQKSDENLVSGIGGLTYGMSVEEATGAYSTFANGGVYKKSHLITRIVDRTGYEVYRYKPTAEKVFSPDTAYILTDMMKDVVKSGTAAGVGAHFPGRQIAGKTGTTDGTTDSWFVGYTPAVTLGIWVGYDIPYPMADLSAIDASGSRPLKIWDDIMDKVYPKLPAEPSFPPMPETIARAEVCTKSGKIPTDLCRALGTVTTDLFVKGTEPKELCDTMVSVKYVELNGKKYLMNDKLSAMGSVVKEGIFIKRKPYELPDGNEKYRPTDAYMELPQQFAKNSGTSASAESGAGTSAGSPVDIQIVSNTPTSVTLAWKPVTEADGYVMMRSTSPTGPFQIISEHLQETQYTDATVQAGISYYFQVCAIQNGTIQPAVASVQVTPGATHATEPGENPGTPGPSSDTTATAPVLSIRSGSTGQAELAWTPSAAAFHYLVEQNTGSGWRQIANTTTNSYTLLASDGDSFRVKAVDPTGQISISNTIRYHFQ
ncbi:PBP1A family penicillin-binding protein [Effusibacillus dendaii]|uniref:Penicillin-binding protein 1A n=1 Tax=Effusibacillus dendaii TaxID=2743772 RepID=A0A7I8DHJ3_9BACL|nr:PBP1A family penicillin-binding protein [Effusibacillus dendaii]BCJ88100.1 penicillin-binding protein 1A [Effusibacillus dendaii]